MADIASFIINIFLFLLSIGSLGISFHLFFKDYKNVVLPAATYFIHSIVFYAVSSYGSYSGLSMSRIFGVGAISSHLNISNIWSATLRLHALFTILILMFIVNSQQKAGKK